MLFCSICDASETQQHLFRLGFVNHLVIVKNCDFETEIVFACSVNMLFKKKTIFSGYEIGT